MCDLCDPTSMATKLQLVMGSAMEFYQNAIENVKAVDPTVDLSDANDLYPIFEAMAGKFLFAHDPPAVALTLSIVLHRHSQMLDEWADFILKTNSASLDAITDPESREAVSRASERREGH